MPIIITGPINSGKSSFAYQLAELLLQKQVAVGGIVNLPVIENGEKVGFDAYIYTTQKLTKLSTVEKNIQHFARRKSLVPTPTPSDIEIGQWIIFNNCIRFCIQKIEKAIQNNSQVIIIDEIGPLELQGKGFRSILDKILLGEQKLPFHLLLVVRDSAVETVKRLYLHREFIIYNHQTTSLTEIMKEII